MRCSQRQALDRTRKGGGVQELPVHQPRTASGPFRAAVGTAAAYQQTDGVLTAQVSSGPHNFTYDYVFGGTDGEEPQQLYDKCVAPLVEGLFKGYNATVRCKQS